VDVAAFSFYFLLFFLFSLAASVLVFFPLFVVGDWIFSDYFGRFFRKRKTGLFGLRPEPRKRVSALRATIPSALRLALIRVLRGSQKSRMFCSDHGRRARWRGYKTELQVI